MALRIENGFPAVTLDFGNGPARVVSTKYVANGEWYQFIIDRTGMNVKLIIREQLPGGKIYETINEEKLEGYNSIFNLDRNQSKIFLGSYPTEFKMQDNIRMIPFEGDVEELTIGDRPISLWNFKHGEDNGRGARER